jgi:uncharacterized protein (TIGR00369 family)
MIKIKNPFINIDEHKCFCCSSSNPIGLKLDFWYNEVEKSVETTWNPDKYLQGYPNVLHGGIQSTLMDEVASWALYVLMETAGVTSKLEIRFRKPVYVNKGTIKVTAKLIGTEKRLANFRTELYDSENNLCAEGLVQYFFYPQGIAKEQLNYPGIEAFLNK